VFRHYEALPLFILLTLTVLASVQPKASFAQDEQTATARKAISKVVPVYPSLARSMNLSGAGELEVLVQPNGDTKTIQVKGGNPLLAQSAQAAVRAWKWEKTEHESTETVEFHFTP
jgi:outer membrane biosynthesis protein TonB